MKGGTRNHEAYHAGSPRDCIDSEHKALLGKTLALAERPDARYKAQGVVKEFHDDGAQECKRHDVECHKVDVVPAFVVRVRTSLVGEEQRLPGNRRPGVVCSKANGTQDAGDF